MLHIVKHLTTKFTRRFVAYAPKEMMQSKRPKCFVIIAAAGTWTAVLVVSQFPTVQIGVRQRGLGQFFAKCILFSVLREICS